MNIFAKVLLWQGKPEAFYILGTSEGKLAPVDIGSITCKRLRYTYFPLFRICNLKVDVCEFAIRF